ncbi:MAG: hypothetical protein P4L26_08345, partial [Terracidiphilus sp.]|nr:hypothetical protein [Terracidiphilus sp.]
VMGAGPGSTRPDRQAPRAVPQLLYPEGTVLKWLFPLKLFHNPVLKGHGFSRAATEQENRGL